MSASAISASSSLAGWLLPSLPCIVLRLGELARSCQLNYAVSLRRIVIICFHTDRYKAHIPYRPCAYYHFGTVLYFRIFILEFLWQILVHNVIIDASLMSDYLSCQHIELTQYSTSNTGSTMESNQIEVFE